MASQTYHDNKTKTTIEGITVDFVNHQTFYEGDKIKLTFYEQRVLEVLIRQPYRIRSLEDLVDELYSWRKNGGPQSNSVKVHICTLRKKLLKATGCRYILTVPWTGYQFVKPEDWYPVCMRK